MDKNNDMKRRIFNEYASRITKVFDITEDSLFSKSKHKDIVHARYMLHYLCFKRPMNINTIMEYMSDSGYPMSYSNIQYGINEMKKRIRRDKDYSAAYKKIKEEV